MAVRTTPRRLAACGLALAAGLAAAPACAADDEARALATPVTAAWKGLPIRSAADRLAGIGAVAVVVDRRIDPGARVSLDARGETLADVLGRLADEVGAEATAYAGHVRLVPRGHGAALAAAERARGGELRSLTARFRPAIQRRDAMSWPEGAVPRELVAAAVAEAGIVLAGLDELPHDHFPAAELPPLPLADRIDLLLAHFDRRVEWKPRAARGSRETVYPIVTIAAADTAANGGPLPAKPTTAAAAGRAGATATTFTLTVAAPLEELLATLARRFGLALDLDRAGLAGVGVAPGEIVRLELHDATRERVLDAILGPRGLAWRIDGGRLSVTAPDR